MKEKGLLKMSFVLALILCSTIKITAQANKAYASLSTDKKTLTFYYDDQKSTRSGMGIGPFAYGSNRDWYLDVSSITTVKFDASFAGYSELTSTANWFDDCTNLSAIQGIENLNTTNVTDMHFMFSDCSSLTSLDLSSLKLSKVTSLRMMFQGCSSLTNLNIEGWDTSSVTDMFGLLMDCRSLTGIDLSALKTSHVTNMQDVFAGCDELTAIKLDDINTSNVTTMWGMFRGCPKLTSLDLSSFNTAKVTDMSNMFLSCEKLVTIYVSSNWVTTAVTESSDMFGGCYKLVGGKGTAYSSSNSTHTYAQIDGGTSSPGYLTLKVEEKNITFADSKVKELCVANWDTNNDGELSESEAAAVTTLGTVFQKKADIKSFNELQYFTGLTSIRNGAFSYSSLTNVTIPKSVVSIMDDAFDMCTSLQDIVIPDNVVTIGKDAFAGCTAMKKFTIGSGLTSIGKWAFRWTELERFDVSASNAAFISVDGILFSKDIKELIYYPSKRAAHSYTVPNTVTKIDDYAFFKCELGTINVPVSVTEIVSPPYAFYSESLKNIVVEDDNSVYSSIDGVLFDKQKSTLICYPKGKEGAYTIPNGVTTIEREAFYTADNLKEITFPEGLTTIKVGAFYYYSGKGFTTITLPASLTSIGDVAFHCDILETVHMKGATPPTITGSPFIPSPKAIYVPRIAVDTYKAAWPKLADIIFADPDDIPTGSFSISNVEDGVLTGDEAHLVIKLNNSSNYDQKGFFGFYYYYTEDMILGYSWWPSEDRNEVIVKPGENTYEFDHAVESALPAKFVAYFYPEEGERIELGSVVINSKIASKVEDKNITFADSKVKELCVANWDTNGDGELSESEAAAVTTIGSVFKSKKDITSFDELVYFTGITTIGYSAFSFSSLTSVTIPKSVVSIMDDAFDMCTSLQDIVIPDNVVTIGKDAFAGCTAMKKFTIGSGLTSIGKWAFRWTELERFDVSASNAAFISVDGILFSKDIKELIYYPSKRAAHSYTVPNTVTKIDDYAFFKCELGTINVPVSVTEIVSPPYAFYSESLKNIVVEDDNSVYSSIDGVLFDKQKSTLICYPKGKEGAYTIPNGVTTIEREAFYTADNLKEITFPEGLTTIKVGAFYYYSGKGFTTITLPASLTSIGDVAFHCDILETVHMKGATPPTITGSPFIPSPKAIYVPRIAVDTYKAAWPKLADIIFADPDDIPTGSFSISNVEDGVLTGDEAHLVIKLNNSSNYDQKGFFGFYYYYTEDMILGYSWWPSEDRNEVIVKPGENTYEFDHAVESALPAKFVAYFYPEEGERIELGSVVINSKIASGIQTITDDSQPFDVFDLRGNKVASKVKSLKGLPKGVYIVNGKKIIKK